MSLASCLTTLFRRIGGLSGSLIREGERLSASFGRVGGMEGTFGRAGERLTAAWEREGAMSCSFGLVCVNSVGEEDVLWASDGRVINKLGEKIYITVKG